MIRSCVWFILLSAVVVLPLSGCRSEANATNSTPAANSAVDAGGALRTVSVERQLLDEGRIALSVAQQRLVSDELQVTGQVIAPPHGKAEIGSLLASRIRGIFVEEGQVVRKGQILATLVAPDAARISGELAAARARRARAEVVLAQEKRLAEQSATSERAVSEATSEAASARANETAASVMLGTYDVNGSLLTLRAPLAGIVASSNALLGAQVDPETILFRVIDPAQFVVRADVPESVAHMVLLGSSAELRLPSRGTSCGARIVSTTRSVDPIKRTVSFRIKPDESCPAMLEGGFVDVLIFLDGKLKRTVDEASAEQSAKTATSQRQPLIPEVPRAQSSTTASDAAAGAPNRGLIAVPRSSVVELDGVPVAFVAMDPPNQFRIAPLTIARHSETTSWVEQGLQAGDRVASRGALLLKGEWMRHRLE